jgi:hypothetical protein
MHRHNAGHNGEQKQEYQATSSHGHYVPLISPAVRDACDESRASFSGKWAESEPTSRRLINALRLLRDFGLIIPEIRGA